MAKSKNPTQSTTQVVLLGVLLTLVLVATIGLALVKPQLDKMFAANAEAVELEAEEARLRNEVIDLNRKLSEVEEQSEAVAEFAASFPGTAAQREMFAGFSEVAAANGVAISSIVPAVPEVGVGVEGEQSTGQQAATTNGTAAPADTTSTNEGEGTPEEDLYPLASIPITITAAGDWEQIRGFVRDVEEMERAVLIDSVTYTSTGVTMVGRQFIAREMAPLNELLPAVDGQESQG